MSSNRVSRSWRFGALVLLVGLTLTVVAYLPALQAGFYFDDEPNITGSPAVQWTSVSIDGVKRLLTETNRAARVVANLSLALNHLAGGLDPRGYHLVNLLVHLAVGVALAWSCVLLALEDKGGIEPGWAGVPVVAAASAALFLLHPLNTQAVTYVVQRMTSLAALFGLLAFSCYLTARSSPAGSWRRWGWIASSVACWLLALGSKESALVLPAVAVAHHLAFRRGLPTGVVGSQASRRGWSRLVRACVLALVVLVLVVVVVSYSDSLSWGRTFPNRDFSGLERLLTQPRVHLLYLSLLAWPAPSRLNLDHDFEVSRSLVEPAETSVALLLALAAGFGAIVLTWRFPRYGFPLMAYLLLHLTESGPINLELVFEHRMYFPMAALAWLLAAVGVDLDPRRRRLALLGVVLVAVALAGATYRRNEVWADPTALHYDCARKSPEKFRPQYNLGTHLGRAGRLGEAIPVLEKAVQLRPASSEAHNQLGSAYFQLGLMDKAEAQYRHSVRLAPGNVEANYNLGMVLERRGATREAVEFYRKFVELAPPELQSQVNAVRRRLHEMRPAAGD